MIHTCHCPGCPVEVPRKMFACKPHWFQLPKDLRDAIYAHYTPGQEHGTVAVSREYLEVAQQAKDWWTRKDTP